MAKTPQKSTDATFNPPASQASQDVTIQEPVYSQFVELRQTFRVKRTEGGIDSETIEKTANLLRITDEEAEYLLSGKIFVAVDEERKEIRYSKQELDEFVRKTNSAPEAEATTLSPTATGNEDGLGQNSALRAGEEIDEDKAGDQGE